MRAGRSIKRGQAIIIARCVRVSRLAHERPRARSPLPAATSRAPRVPPPREAVALVVVRAEREGESGQRDYRAPDQITGLGGERAAGGRAAEEAQKRRRRRRGEEGALWQALDTTGRCRNRR